VSDIIGIFDKYEKFNIKTNNSLINLKIKKNGIEEKFLINDKEHGLSRRLNKEPVGVKKKIYNFIPSYMVGDDLIISIFNKIKEQRKREQLNKILNEFDKNILEFDIINDMLQVFLDSSQKFQNVVELGHGLKRYIAIISSILINKDGFLFLDELENGVHYTKLDKLWEIILTISKQQNVQVFATTHSKECIESYARVAKKLEDEEITFIELGKNDENEITSIVYEYDDILNQVAQHQDIRGW
jgi:AAA15 family ATPase/GTPase